MTLFAATALSLTRFIAATMLCLALHPMCHASAGVFPDFQEADGAVRIIRHGDTVDPYFALKAFWVLSHDRVGANPADEQQSAMALMRWMLPLQQVDGSFGRACLNDTRTNGKDNTSRWTLCKRADADDLMTALWIYNVLRYAPDDNAWNGSARKALDHLAVLWDPQRSVFRLFKDQIEALFIDNMELLALLPVLQDKTTLKRLQLTELTGPGVTYTLPDTHENGLVFFKNLKPTVFKLGIEQTFGISLDKDIYPKRLAMPGRLPGLHFYPQLVAPIYIWLTPSQPLATAKLHWKDWWALVGQSWLDHDTDPYPWALIALVAARLDLRALQQWQAVACKHRQRSLWTVLDEAVWLRLKGSTSCNTLAPP